MPKRLITPAWYRQHRELIGFLVLSIAVLAAFAITSITLHHLSETDRNLMQTQQQLKDTQVQLIFAQEKFAETDVKVCAYANANREIMRTILRDSNKRTQTSAQRSPEEKRIAQDFYRQLLKRIPAIKCAD